MYTVKFNSLITPRFEGMKTNNQIQSETSVFSVEPSVLLCCVSKVSWRIVDQPDVCDVYKSTVKPACLKLNLPINIIKILTPFPQT